MGRKYDLLHYKGGETPYIQMRGEKEFVQKEK